jgi:hypothetical protein
MDERPFLELDLFDFSEPEVEELKNLRKSTFDLEEMVDAAHDLKYRKALQGYLEQQLQEPEEDFVHWMTGKVYDGRVTQNVRDQFRGIVRKALHQLVHDKVRGRLSSALQEEANAADSLSEPDQDEDQLPEGVVEKDGEIVTTEDEIRGFRIVRAIMAEAVGVDRVTRRDVKTYFNVLLDDNNRQPICRLWLNQDPWYLELILDEEKNTEKVEIESLNEIYAYKDELQKTVQFYDD